jgi:hypothetical protein
MVYELQREGRTFYCNSSDAVTALVRIGWTVSVMLEDDPAGGGASAAPGKTCPAAAEESSGATQWARAHKTHRGAKGH